MKIDHFDLQFSRGQVEPSYSKLDWYLYIKQEQNEMLSKSYVSCHFDFNIMSEWHNNHLGMIYTEILFL